MTEPQKLRVAVIFGGRSAEHEISILSARFVVSALDKDRFEPVLIGIDKDGRWLLQDTEDKDTGFAVSLWESAGEMQAYEQGDLYRQELAPALQPFFVGDYKTYRCDVKYMQ